MKSTPRKDGGSMGRCPRLNGNVVRFLHFLRHHANNAQSNVLATCGSEVKARNKAGDGLTAIGIMVFIISQYSNKLTVAQRVYRQVAGSTCSLSCTRTGQSCRILSSVLSRQYGTVLDTDFL